MVRPLPESVRLLRSVTGHDGAIGHICWSPDGLRLAAASSTGTVGIWDVDSGVCLRTIRSHHGGIVAAAFDPKESFLATGGNDGGTRLWDVDSGELRTTLASGASYALAFSPRDRLLVTAGNSPHVTLWDLATGAAIGQLTEDHGSQVVGLAFNDKGGTVAAGSREGTITMWAVPRGSPLRTLEGHSGPVYAVAFHPDGGILASAGYDRTVRLWDAATGRTISVLEGHTEGVLSLSFSADGRVLASNSGDGTVRLWETAGGRCRAVLPTPVSWLYWVPSVAFNPERPVLAVVALDAGSETENDRVVQLWELDVDRLLEHPTTPSVSYTTAKIVLVGETGVGKTGLGWRLAHGKFIEHASTHGQQFWLLDELCSTTEEGIERDAILWDLAGQPDYRLIHALYLDDAHLALLLFDPTRGDDPLRGVEYWLHQIGQDRPVILVAARGDRGSPRLTMAEIEAFCAERGIAGYVATSALSGEGLDELIELMRTSIRWDRCPTTVTTQTFKRIKTYVLGLKETPGPENTILGLQDLRTCLAQEYPDSQFSDKELMTAVRHLSNHGCVAQLRNSHGEPRILLTPTLLNNLASSMILEARRNPKDLGALDEQQMLAGGYHLPELSVLSTKEQEVLLDSAVAMFLAHSVCFRETDPLSRNSYLVFPELINLKKPVIADEQPIEEGASYTVCGAVENVYASLVVLLGYTSTFTRTNQWRDHARYVVGDGLVCGLRKEDVREGELDLVLYYGATVGTPIRTLFQSLVESFLARHALTVCRYDVTRCAQDHPLNRAVVRERLAQGAHHAYCPECGQRVALPPADTPIELTRAQVADRDTQRQAAKQRSRFEEMLFRLTSYVTQEGIPAPDCFVSYAWGEDHHERWVENNLATDLANAGITVLLDRWENGRIGASVPRFIERIAGAARVIVVGTPLYRTKYDNNDPMGAFVVAAEGDLIGKRMIGSEADKASVLPLLLAGTSESSFPPLLQGRVYADFRSAQRYLTTVFDLIVSLYQIPSHGPVHELRRQLEAGVGSR